MTGPGRRNVVILVVLVAVVAAVGVGAGFLLHERSDRARHTAASPGPTSATPAGPGAGASPTPSRSPDLAATLGLPRGGRVPAGFADVSVTTTAHGITYLLGYASCRTAPCTSVARYDGTHWVSVAAPEAAVTATQPSTRSDTVRDLRFGTPKDGWAYGGALWSTHDGARRWRSVDAGGAVVDLAADDTTAYAVVSRCTGSSSTCRVKLRSTTVRGDVWRDVPGVAAAGSSGRLSLGPGTAAVSFPDSGIVYLRSGGTWRSATVSCPDGSPGMVASPSSARLFAFCAGPGAGNLDYTIRYSDDGRRWTVLPLGASHLRIPNGTFVSLTAASSTVLLAASGDPSLGGPVMVSRDSGRTWERASGRDGLPDLDTSRSGGWRYVGASSSTRVVALAAVPHRGYWVSHDTARTWQRIVPG
ncbi:MAG TPA: hypothetical protein VGO94_11365 [Mycobacteriales bacterium]|nr:hypothetical protein [Mycobacteriales bacterium]